MVQTMMFILGNQLINLMGEITKEMHLRVHNCQLAGHNIDVCFKVNFNFYDSQNLPAKAVLQVHEEETNCLHVAL